METHPYTLGTMRKKHCSSQFFLHKTLLIPILFSEIIIHRIASTENNNIIHNILTTQTGINVFLFFQVSSHECKIVEAHVRC